MSARPAQHACGCDDGIAESGGDVGQGRIGFSRLDHGAVVGQRGLHSTGLREHAFDLRDVGAVVAGERPQFPGQFDECEIAGAASTGICFSYEGALSGNPCSIGAGVPPSISSVKKRRPFAVTSR
jgi:hypothetical protein